MDLFTIGLKLEGLHLAFQLLEIKMAEQFAALQAKVDALLASAAAERAEVQAMLQSLKDQIAAFDGGATAAQLAELSAALDGAIVGVQNISEPEVPAP